MVHRRLVLSSLRPHLHFGALIIHLSPLILNIHIICKFALKVRTGAYFSVLVQRDVFDDIFHPCAGISFVTLVIHDAKFMNCVSLHLDES